MGIFHQLRKNSGTGVIPSVSILERIETAGLILLIVALTFLYDWWKRN
jgi:hypothetical protein